MRKNINLTLICSLFTTLLLSGCVSLKEEEALVFMMQISSHNGESHVNIEILVNDKSNEKTTAVLTLKGKSIVEALKNSPLMLGSALNLSHLQVIIIDEKNICELVTIINDLDNFYQLVYGVQIVVSNAFDETSETQNQGMAILNKIMMAKKKHLIIPYTLLDFKTHKPILLPMINKEGEIMDEMQSLEGHCKLDTLDQNEILIKNILSQQAETGTFCLDKCMDLSNIKIMMDETDLIVQMKIENYQDVKSLSTLIEAFKKQVKAYSHLKVDFEIVNHGGDDYYE